MRNIANLCLTFLSQVRQTHSVNMLCSPGQSPIWTQSDIMELMAQAAPLFEESGAQTFRFARLMTGNNAGDFLLGVGYPSMAEIEATYDAIGSSLLPLQYTRHLMSMFEQSSKCKAQQCDLKWIWMRRQWWQRRSTEPSLEHLVFVVVHFHRYLTSLRPFSQLSCIKCCAP